MSQQLLTQRRFLPYLCTAFLGAFNDNVYKNALIILITYHLFVSHPGVLANVAAGLLIVPYIFFSALAGQLADKYEKSKLIRYLKQAEIFIMLFGCAALALDSVSLMLVTVFFLGTQSSFFSPIKYSILPQHLGSDEILKGNAYVEAATFLAILLGILTGGLLASSPDYTGMLMACLLLVAATGWLASRQIPSAKTVMPELNIDWHILRSSLAIVRSSYQSRTIFQTILAISWFWFFGSLVLAQFPVFTKTVLQGDAQVATLLLATFSIGIALGSLACAKLSGDHVEIGLMPIGALGISFFTWHLSGLHIAETDQLRTITDLLSTEGAGWLVFDLTMMAFSAGLYTVPLYAFIQVSSRDHDRARTIAANNIINSFFMVAAAMFAGVCLYFGMAVPDIFKITAILNILVTLYILSVVPEFFLRLVGWLLIHSVYRIKKYDLHHIPKTGPALLVCNHVSYADPLIINAISNRPIRFVMIENIYRLPIANWLFRGVRAIPIAPSKENPEIVERAFSEIDQALSAGELVCIFPEGGITYDGELQDFKPGIEKIVEQRPVPVVPLAIRGLWGTWFSRRKGGAMRGIPRAFMKRLTVISGEPVAATEVSKELMYDKVLSLRGDEK